MKNCQITVDSMESIFSRVGWFMDLSTPEYLLLHLKYFDKIILLIYVSSAIFIPEEICLYIFHVGLI